MSDQDDAAGKRKRSNSDNGASASESNNAGEQDASSASNQTKKMKPEKLRGIGDGTAGCPYIIMVAPDKVGKIIGGKGAVVQDIKSRSGAKIDINQNFPPGVHRQVQLVGSQDEIDTALYYIEKIIDQGPSAIHPNAVQAGDVQCDKRIECPKSMVGKIIGPSGDTIKDIQHRSGARVQVHQEGLPDDHPRTIQVTGSEAAVTEASKMLFDILNGTSSSSSSSRSSSGPPPPPMKSGVVQSNAYGMGNSMGGARYGSNGPAPSGRIDSGGAGGQFNSTTPAKVFSIEKALVGKLIGKSGETIKQLQKEVNCRIQVKQDQEPCLVEIYGPPDRVRYAEQRIGEVCGGGGGGGGQGYPPNPMAMAGMGMGMGAGGYHHAMPYAPAIPSMQPGQYGAYGQPALPNLSNPYASGYGQQNQGYNRNAAVPPSNAVGGAGGGARYAGALPPRTGSGPSFDQSVWSEYFTAEGKSYWHNKSTGKVQWERP